MRDYTTISGDMWDMIAKKTLGSEFFKSELMEANKKYRHIYIFPANIKIFVPEITTKPSADLPPWKRVRL
jgi:phage tail protein X